MRKGVKEDDDYPQEIIKQGECAICREDNNPTDSVGLRCGHAFHRDCIEGWRASGMVNSNRCPECRRIIPAGDDYAPYPYLPGQGGKRRRTYRRREPKKKYTKKRRHLKSKKVKKSKKTNKTKKTKKYNKDKH